MSRITWKQPDQWHHDGYVGTNGPLFAITWIRSGFERGRPWLLVNQLPGLDHLIAHADGDHLDQLKTTAEDWLAQFAASIGATFTDQT